MFQTVSALLLRHGTEKPQERRSSERSAAVTRVYGPSHEQRRVLLQVPAVTCRMHPGDLEDPLLLKISTASSACGRPPEERAKRRLTYLVDPLQPRDLTRIDLFLQPRPHPHSFYRHCDLRERGGNISSCGSLRQNIKKHVLTQK